MATTTGDTMTDQFLPTVTFTDDGAARDCYFAVSAMCHAAGDDLRKAARDDSVTQVQFDVIAAKHERLNKLAATLFDEWQRLAQPQDEASEEGVSQS